jgi:REP-associated tyrosine transposase
MERYESLHHTKWECKYHLVWIPKCRKKVLYGQLRRDLGLILRKLALQKESEVLEGKLKVDHVHMVVSIPPKYSVSQVVGYVKGKSAIWVARATVRSRNFVGQNFWARGYCVSTVGLDEETIREYVRSQEEADKKLDQLRMFE